MAALATTTQVDSVSKTSSPSEIAVYIVQETRKLEFSDEKILESLAITCKESRYDGRDLNPVADNPGSTADGLLQIINQTWKDWNCTGDKKDPADNLRCGLPHLKETWKPWEASRSLWLPLYTKLKTAWEEENKSPPLALILMDMAKSTPADYH